MLQANPRMSDFGSIGLILDDLQEKDRLLSRILISKYYLANPFTCPEKRSDEIEKVCHRQIRLWRKKPDLLILDFNFSEASIIRILQKVRKNKPSLPILICPNSVTEQFRNQAAQLGVFVFFRKADVARSLCLEIRRPPVWVEQILDQIKKLSLPDGSP